MIRVISILTTVVLYLCCSPKHNVLNYKKFTYGKYSYNKDSLITPNMSYAESLIFDEVGSFVHLQRIGSFINTKIEGSWSRSGDTLILNSHNNFDETLEVLKKCDAILDEYLFKVKNLKGEQVNYNLEITTTDTTFVVRDQIKESILTECKNLKSIKIISSSGFTSLPFLIPKDKNCFSIRFNDVRFFKNEKWLIESNKISQIGNKNFDTLYYLYLE